MENVMEYQYDVFISHSSQDKAIAIGIYEYLTQHGLKCWLDVFSIPPSRPYAAAIIEGLEASRCFMLIYSKNIIGSQDILNEIDKAHKDGKQIFSYVIDKTPLKGELAYYLSRPQWIIAYPNYKDNLSILLNSIKVDVPGVIPEKSTNTVARKNKWWLWVLCVGVLIGLLCGASIIYRNYFNPHEATTISENEGVVDTSKVVTSEVPKQSEPKVAKKSPANTQQVVKQSPTTDVKQQVKTATSQPIEKEEQKKEEVAVSPKDETRKVFTIGAVSFTMIKVDGGSFMMGVSSEQDSDAYADEMPVHEVQLSDYYVGETEVTQALWYAVLGLSIEQQRDKKKSELSLRGVGDSYPVYYVSYDDCKAFIKVLNRLTNANFRLLTEAEWEYAARGGNKKSMYKYAGSPTIDQVGWYKENSNNSSQPVASKTPNELGLYDMTGNVSEWCVDWYDNYTTAKQVDPQGAQNGMYRVYRGGSWYDKMADCRVTCRTGWESDYRNTNLGFRLALQE